MYQEIIIQLKKLRNVAPDAAFHARSKSVILALHEKQKPRIAWLPALAWAGALAAVLLVATVFFPAPNPSSLSISLLNTQRISEEFDNLTISIQLKEIRYNQNADQTIASAINEIGETRAGHLNGALIESEFQAIQQGTGEKNGNIDRLLREVIL